MAVTIPGVDYAWSHPGGAALQKAKKQFACRYSSNDPSKDLTRDEADDLAAHGVSSVIVRESVAERAGQGRPAGIADAKAAVATANACGMPAGRPLYFAVDYAAEPATVVPYFEGVASVIGVARTGVYGGYKVVRYLLDHKLVTWAWQTRAWSAGQWDARAHIRQLAYITINGVQCDDNQAYAADYGQWMPGKTPEVDVPLTKTDVELLLSTTMDDPTDPGKKTITVRGALWAAYGEADRAAGAAEKLLTQVAALSATVKTLSGLIGKNVDTPTVVAAVEAAIATAVVHVNVDVTGDQPAA